MKLLNRVSKHIFWRIDRKKRLILFGRGGIPEYAPASGYRKEPPWKGLEFNEVIIGKGITDIPPTALPGIDLDKITIAGAGRRKDGLEIDESGLYNHRRKELLLASDQKKVALLEGTVDIHPFAFAFHQKVETVECPASLQRIGVSAFEGCKKLRSIYRLPADAVIGSKALKGTSGVRVYFDRYHAKRKLCEIYPRTAITEHGRGFLMNGEFTFFASEDGPNIDPTKFYRYQDLIDFETFKASSDPAELFQLYRREDIDTLMADFATERLHYIGTDMATNYMRSCIDEMDEELFQMYLQYHFVICERSDMVGVSHHILDVHRKR